jgi:hypothetical protein
MPRSPSEGLKFDHSSVYNSRMNQSEFKAGEAWAMRTSGAQDSPVIRVEAVNFIKRGATRRVRVRHLDGDLQGFEELVTTLRLISTWTDWPKVQRDNANLERLRDHVNANNPPDQVTCEAASAVLASSSEDLYVCSFTRWVPSNGWRPERTSPDGSGSSIRVSKPVMAGVTSATVT